MRFLLTAVISALFFLSSPASATEVHFNCKDDNSMLSEPGHYDDDYLFAGSELDFSGETEDLVFIGKTLTFRGKSRLGLIAFGKKVLYTGESGNGIITGGMSTVIDGKISGTNFMAGKSIQITETAEINGTLFMGCAKAILDGPINGDLYAGAGELNINNVINGNVTVYGGRILIGDKGKINGNLTYGTKEKLSDKNSGKVTGSITYDTTEHFNKDTLFSAKTGKVMHVVFTLGMFISFLVIGCLLLFFPAFGILDNDQPERTFWYTSLWGLIPLLMYPAVILLCLVLIVTIPLGLGLILAFIPLLSIAYIIGTTLAGKYIITKFKWNITRRHYRFLVGAIAATAVSIIPFINVLSFLFLSALGFGMYLTLLFKRELVTVRQ